MLSDKLKRLEQMAKEVSKDAELTDGVRQLIGIPEGCRKLSEDEMRVLWVEKYNCDKKQLHNAVRDALRACINASRAQLPKYD